MKIFIDAPYLQNAEAQELCKKIDKLCEKDFSNEKIDITATNGQGVIWSNTPVLAK